MTSGDRKRHQEDGGYSEPKSWAKREQDTATRRHLNTPRTASSIAPNRQNMELIMLSEDHTRKGMNDSAVLCGCVG